MLKCTKSVESKASFLRSKDEAEEGAKTSRVEKSENEEGTKARQKKKERR